MSMKKLGILALTLLLLTATTFASAEGIAIKSGEFSYAFSYEDMVLVTAKADFPIVVGMSDETAMLSVNSVIRDTIEREFGYADLCNAAIIDYAVFGRNFKEYKYFTNVIAEPAKQTERLLGVRFNFEGDFGGAHGDYWECFEYFDLSNGFVVTLHDMVTDPEAFRTILVEDVLAQITAEDLEKRNELFDDYETYVHDWTLDDGLLTDDGLVVYFYQSTIGPYSAGPQYFTVPYDKIADQWNELGKAMLGL